MFQEGIFVLRLLNVCIFGFDAYAHYTPQNLKQLNIKMGMILIFLKRSMGSLTQFYFLAYLLATDAASQCPLV